MTFGFVAAPMWWQGAICRNEHLGCDSFFGADTFKAIQICSRCPVRMNCLQAGLTEDWGVWGGATNQQRFRIRRLVEEGYTLTEAFTKVTQRNNSYGR